MPKGKPEHTPRSGRLEDAVQLVLQQQSLLLELLCVLVRDGLDVGSCAVRLAIERMILIVKPAKVRVLGLQRVAASRQAIQSTESTRRTATAI